VLFLVLIPILLGAYRLARWQKPSASGVAFSADGRLIASSYYVYDELSEAKYGHIEVRSLTTGKRLMRTHQDSIVGSLAFSSDRSTLTTGHFDGSIRLWNLTTRRPVVIRQPTAGLVSLLGFGRDGRTLVAVSRTGLVLLEADTGRQIAAFESPGHMYGAAFAADHNRLAVSVYDEESEARGIRVYDVGNDEFERVVVIADLDGQLAWSPDASRLAVANGSQVQLWSIDQDKAIGRLRTGRVHAITLSPDGASIAAPGRDGAVDLWDVQTGARTATLIGPGDIVYNVGYSPDGTILAATSADGTTTLWDVATTRRLAVFSSHRSTVLMLWGLLAAFLVWCILWVWSGTRSVAKWRPAWDVALLNCYVSSHKKSTGLPDHHALSLHTRSSADVAFYRQRL
jgi:WD40 repeat protein